MPAFLLLSAAALVLGLAAAIALLLTGRAPVTGVARSLALIEQAAAPTEVLGTDRPVGDRLLGPFYRATRDLAVRISPTGSAARLGRMLELAGNPAMWTVERLLGVKGAALLVLGLLGAMLGGGITPAGLLIAVAAGAAGFFLPDLLVYNLGLKRQEELRRGLADALDMLTVCVEAGQGFDAALMQVSRTTTGAVAGEFARVLQEVQIGKPRAEAFSGLSQRTNVAEVKTFVTALVQADRLGLPIGGVLREQANQMRLVRRQRAGEQAQKVTVKILFPLLFCIFPALMIVVIGPGAIRMMGSFSGM